MDKMSLARLKVSNIMTKTLITATPDVTVEVAVKRMIDNDVECLPIVDVNGELSGLITFRDVVKKVVYTSAFGWEVIVEEIMVRNVTTLSPDSTLLDAIKIMKNKHLRRIPIVDVRSKLVGLVTNFDLALFGWETE